MFTLAGMGCYFEKLLDYLKYQSMTKQIKLSKISISSFHFESETKVSIY